MVYLDSILITRTITNMENYSKFYGNYGHQLLSHVVLPDQTRRGYSQSEKSIKKIIFTAHAVGHRVLVSSLTSP